MEYLGSEKDINKAFPLVSVIVLGYQHASYIKQCLESVLNQQTLFQFEIILGEDESTDGTREICKDFADRNPDKIRLFLRERKNVIYVKGKPSGKFNLVECLKACRGKYIAICDGDDYWTDQFKLQKQVDIISKGYSIVYHNTIKNHDGNVIATRPPVNYEFDFKDSICSKNGNTLSMLFAREYLRDWQLKLLGSRKLFVGDWPLECFMTMEAKGYFMKEVMGFYRVHGEGRSKNFFSMDNYYLGRLSFLNELVKRRDLLKKEIYKVVLEAQLRICSNYILYSLSKLDFKSCFWAARALPLSSSFGIRFTSGWKKSFRYDYYFSRKSRKNLRRE